MFEVSDFFCSIKIWEDIIWQNCIMEYFCALQKNFEWDELEQQTKKIWIQENWFDLTYVFFINKFYSIFGRISLETPNKLTIKVDIHSCPNN